MHDFETMLLITNYYLRCRAEAASSAITKVLGDVQDVEEEVEEGFLWGLQQVVPGPLVVPGKVPGGPPTKWRVGNQMDPSLTLEGVK